MCSSDLQAQTQRRGSARWSDREAPWTRRDEKRRSGGALRMSGEEKRQKSNKHKNSITVVFDEWVRAVCRVLASGNASVVRSSKGKLAVTTCNVGFVPTSSVSSVELRIGNVVVEREIINIYDASEW